MSGQLERLLAQATPGPWVVHDYEEEGRRYDDVRPESGESIIVYPEGCYLPETERANLDLIALTPTLARLLVDAADFLNHAVSAVNNPGKDWPQLEALLARFAEVEQQAGEGQG